MALGMHIGFATHQKVQNWAIMRLTTYFYPFEYWYISPRKLHPLFGRDGHKK